MTITGTSTHQQLMVAWARHDIETLTGVAPSRERAERVLREWHTYAALTGAEIADVLAAYLPDEPPMVAGRDWLPADLAETATADAALIVAEVGAENLRILPKNLVLEGTIAALPEPKPGQQYVDFENDLWQVQSDGTLLWLDTQNIGDRQFGLTKKDLAELARDWGPLSAGPLVEVTDEPTVVEGEITSPYGPCRGLALDSRDNICPNFATEYVEWSANGDATNLRRLCTPCADRVPNVYSRRPLTRDVHGNPVERAW